MNLGQGVAVQRDELPELFEIGERIEPGRVSVSPNQFQGIVSNLFDIFQLGVAAGLEGDRPRVSLTTGTGTISPQEAVWNPAGHALGPLHLEPRRTVGSFDTCGTGRQGGHCARNLAADRWNS